MCSWPNLVQIVSHLGILEIVSPFLAFDVHIIINSASIKCPEFCVNDKVWHMWDSWGREV